MNPILDLLEAEAECLYHVACRSCVTPYVFGHEIAQLQGGDETLIEESEQADVSRDAARPSYTCLDVTAVEEELGRPQQTLTEDLRMIETQFEL